MQVTESLVNKLAALARLEFDANEKAAIQKDLQQIITFVEKLDELDLAGVEPLRQVSPVANVTREDVRAKEWNVDDAMKNASQKDGNYFVVPKMVRKDN
jgi:aspartyl-tRNA(Asn)/glutamyl-tRNA(Gln) amidotransferase subunit C